MSVPLVLDMAMTNEALQAGGGSERVASHLGRLVASSALGEALFVTKLLKLADKAIDNTIASHLKAFASRSHIGLEDIATTEAAIVSEVKQLASPRPLRRLGM